MNAFKKVVAVLSILTGFLAYAYMVVTTAKSTGEGLSLTTFGLWAALAWISAFTMRKQGASYAVPMMYGSGGTKVTFVLLYKGKFGWTAFDSIIAGLVIVCVVLWLTSGVRWALIMSVVAAVIAAIPFIMLSWKDPVHTPIVASSGFLLTNILSLIAAKAWTLEDRLYPGVNVIVCALLVIPWLLFVIM